MKRILKQFLVSIKKGLRSYGHSLIESTKYVGDKTSINKLNKTY
jgi:hypothetical protein